MSVISQPPRESSANSLDFPSTVGWSMLWARCSPRIDSWRIPPGWSRADWRDETHSQGALAAFQALRDFDPIRGVPQTAFLYHRVVASVWNFYRQEWVLARRRREFEDNPAAPESSRLDPDLFPRLASLLNTLSDAERDLIVQLFWEGRTERELAASLGITKQAVNKRKLLAMKKLRTLLGSVA